MHRIVFAILVVAWGWTNAWKYSDAKSPDYWPRYSGKRRVVLLDGLWMTSRIGSIESPPPASFDSMDPSFDPRTIRTFEPTTIPSCVDNTPPGYLGYRGVSFFRRDFHFDLSNGGRLQFQACSFYCRVWVNGRSIGDHRTGYVAFSLDVPPQHNSILSTHEVFVLVDNRFNKTTAPLHTGGDFWHYGGIMRSVELHALPPRTIQWPWRLYIFPTSQTTVRLELQLTSNSSISSPTGSSVRLGFDGGPRFTVQPTTTLQVSPTGVVDLGIYDMHNVTTPRLWSPSNPQLHTVDVELDGAIVTERFGLRMFEVDSRKSQILLNGQQLQLVGWNHHTQWPDTAASPTTSQLDHDLLLLKNGGANYVRGAHYPQDPRWLDRLDESGIVVWGETLGPDVSVNDTSSSLFRKYQQEQLHEMLDNAMNHASIAIWAFFNEGPSHSEVACSAYQECSDIIHSRDPTRFVSYASNKQPPRDKCYATADIISLNSYPGWYQKKPPSEFWPHTAALIRSGELPHTKGKPFLISETGAGGIFEWKSNTTDSLWTLRYQSKIIEADVNIAIGDPNISGISLWHFFDFKVNDKWENETHCDYAPNVYPPVCNHIDVDTSIAAGRPGGLNHKGVVDFWRRPKPVYEAVARKYRNVTGTMGYTSTTQIQTG